MTERGTTSVTVERNQFCIKRSDLFWDGETLKINIDETTAPIPSSLRGVVTVRPQYTNDRFFTIDAENQHRWRPIAPASRVDVSFDAPDLTWSGNGYLDMNTGDEPLEDAFRYWDWSRAELPGSETAILYNTDLWSGAERKLAVRFLKDGRIEEFSPPVTAILPTTPVWRIKRRTRTDGHARLLKTLEDAPFYSRSMIESDIFGETCRAMHESFSGARFRLPIVKAMLPFRMPRISR